MKGKHPVAAVPGLSAVALPEVFVIRFHTLSVLFTVVATTLLFMVVTVAEADDELSNNNSYTLDSTFFTNGMVRALLIYRGILYIGGNFTRVYDADGGHDRGDVAAYSLSDRRVLSFRADTDHGTVRALAADGDCLFIGGGFTRINNTVVSKVAKVNALSGEVYTGFRVGYSNIDSTVYALAFTSGKLFAGGDFGLVDGVKRRYCAAFDGVSGRLDTTFNPSPDDPIDLDGKTEGGVMAITVHPQYPDIIFVGGNFRSVAGVDGAQYLVALTPQGFPGPSLSGEVRDPVIALDARRDRLYAGLAGFGNRAAAFDIGTAREYKRLWGGFVVEGDVQAVAAAENGLVYFSFHQGLIDTTDFYRVAALDAATGTLFDTLPSMNSFFGVFALEVEGSFLAAGGSFTRIGGRRHGYCALFTIPRYDADAVPEKVRLVAPAEGDTVDDQLVYLKWYLSAFAAGYELQVATDSVFETVVCDEDNADVDKRVKVPVPGQRYWWRVRAVNAGRWSPWSDTASFVVRPGYEDVPQIIAPGWNDIVPVTFDCRWNRVAGALWYELMLTRSWERTGAFIDTTAVVDTFFHLADLTSDTQYVLHVRAVTPGGASEWNDVMFTTGVFSPGMLIPFSPENGSRRIPCTPLLIWNGGGSGAVYHAQVALDPEFSAVVADSSGLLQTWYTVPELPTNTTFYWRVSAENTGGACTTAVWNFTTVAPPPGLPQPLFPPDGYIAEAETLMLRWGTTGSPDESYRIECYSDGGVSTVLCDSVLSDTSLQLVNLDDKKQFLWRVKAGNGSGWSSFSAPLRFSTAFPQSPPPPPEEELPPEEHFVTGLGSFLYKGNKAGIRFELADRSDVTFALYTLHGMAVRVFRNESCSAGRHFEWYPCSGVPGGTYLLRMRTGSHEATVRAMVIR